MSSFPIEFVRSSFPGLSRKKDGRGVIFFDGPGGSQVPRVVSETVSDYLLNQNANTGMAFDTSLETDRIIGDALDSAADFIGCTDSREIVFGQNMTSLNIQLASALSKTWGPGDEVVVTEMDHDGNVRPWVLAAEWAGAKIRKIRIDPKDCTLDFSSIEEVINDSTVMVAVGAASNLSGTINDVKKISSIAHQYGSEVVVDAVHYAPHNLIDVKEIGCDYLLCSSYKFFGPHQGMLWGNYQRMSELPVAKLRASSEEMPFRWMTGTQSHEGMAGTMAAIDYIAGISKMISGKEPKNRRSALIEAYQAIEEYENQMSDRLIRGLVGIRDLKIWGITDLGKLDYRTPTVSFTHPKKNATQIGLELAERGIFVWSGNFYAIEMTEALGLEPEGVLRVGLLHYNTIEEVDLFLEALRAILS